MATYKKGDQERLDYGFDWSALMTAEGVEISSSVWTVPAGLTNEGEGSSSTATSITLSGGTIGESYLVTNEITTTSNGSTTLVFERSFYIVIVETKFK